MALIGGNAYIPVAPQTVTIRPLNIGMVTEGVSATLPIGSFQKVRGMDVQPEGLKRLGGWESISTLALTPIIATEKVQDFFVLNLADGSSQGLVVTDRFLYQFDGTLGFTPVPWRKEWEVKAYDGSGTDGIITVDGDEIADSLLAAGDLVLLGTTYWPVKSVSYDSINTETDITLTGKPTTGPSPTDKFFLYKPFATPDGFFTDWTIGRNKAYLVDGITLCVFQYDGLWLSQLEIYDAAGTTRTMYTARTICHYKERLWFGNVVEPESGVTIRPTQRVRWTEVLDWRQSEAGNYADMTYKAGPVRAIRSSDTMLLVFMTDTIYYGVQSNLVGLPYAFYELQTGNISAVGQKAIGSMLGTTIFVGRDDVYVIEYTEAGPKMSRIGSTVAKTMLRGLGNRELTVVKVDPANSRVVVGTSVGGALVDKMWFWNYKTKGWSWDEDVVFQALCGTNYVDQLTMDEFEAATIGETYDSYDGAALAIDSFSKEPTGINLFGFDVNGHIYQYNADGTGNQTYSGGVFRTNSVTGILETQDLDLDRPDDIKSFLELGARMAYLEREAAFSLKLEVSIDRGRSWRSLGRLTFTKDDDEDKLNFRVTAASVRFRITFGNTVDGTNSVQAPWTLEEFTLRVRARTDREAQRGTVR